MQIDWVTIGAQIINFIVLLWLLKRFLYRPVLNAVDRREAEIKSRIEMAASKLKEAEVEHEKLTTAQQSFETERDSLLATAREEANTYRKSLREKMRADIEKDEENWRRGLQKERRRFANELSAQALTHLSSLTGKALKDLADINLESQMTSIFLTRLGELKGVGKKAACKSLKSLGADIISGQALKSNDKTRLKKGLDKLAEADVILRFKTDKSLKPGLKLKTGTQVIEWSLDNYLENFEDNFLKDHDLNNTEPEPVLIAEGDKNG